MPARPRRIECFVLACRHQDLVELLPAAREAIEDRPLVGAFLERLHGHALVQAVARARRAPRFERSLELARGQGADYEVALTLEAVGRTRLGDPDAEAESRAILERLGVLSTPVVPLP
jgi:hypothetical protein